jgi:bloom syndrome protein
MISPLLSMIQDQVTMSMTKLDAESVFSIPLKTETEQRQIMSRLYATSECGGVKLLYTTPEKLNHSGVVKGSLQNLCNRNLISHFIMDEAHCLSDWGRNFCPDYHQLGMLLHHKYQQVPVMALTATANKKVVNDAICCLGMQNEYRYQSSFNCLNLLKYEICKKDGKNIDVMADYISKQSHNSSVIYCLSGGKDCETV